MVGFILLGLIALHTSAAIYHHFWRRDDTLNAMLPRRLRCRDAQDGAHEIAVFHARSRAAAARARDDQKME